MDLSGIAVRIAESGLVTHENYEKNELYVARPASLKGTEFRGWEEDYVSGIGDTILKINAPIAKIEITGKGRKKKYIVEISKAAAPGPGPVWFNDAFKSAEETIQTIISCYFGERIDFNNASLEKWYGQNT